MAKLDPAFEAVPEAIRKEIAAKLRKQSAELRLLARRLDPPSQRAQKARCKETQDWVNQMYVEEGGIQ